MSNAYGFDFLKTQHTLGGADAPRPAGAANEQDAENIVESSQWTNTQLDFEQIALKPDLEKQADILRFLRAHRSAGYLPPSVIYRGTGIDLEDQDSSVAKLLESNPKIAHEQVPDPENPSITLTQYAYQSKFSHVRNRATLLAQINRSKYGVDQRDLLDCYDNVQADIESLIKAGDVIAISNSEDKTTVLFPRGETFLVELDGNIQINSKVVSMGSGGNSKKNGYMHQSATAAAANPIVSVDTDVDPRNQIRRGEAVCVGGQWFRVSSAVRAGVPLSEQPARAQAPLTVTSLTDLPKRNLVDGYIRPMDAKCLPLDGPLSAQAIENLQKSHEVRHLLSKWLSHLGGNSGGGGSGGLAGASGSRMGGSAHLAATQKLLSSLAHASNPISTLQKTIQQHQQHNRVARHAVNGIHGGGPNKRQKTSSSANNGANGAAALDVYERLKSSMATSADWAEYSHAHRHGCTMDVRQMYLETRSLVPTDEVALYNKLIQHGLLQEGEAWRRPKLKKKANVDNDGKPKKRRYYERKGQRMTNTHLVGTGLGALLADAAEKQKQGKSVGDGGM